MAENVNTDVNEARAKLEQAAAGVESESSTEKKTEQETTEKTVEAEGEKGNDKEGWVPRDRLNEATKSHQTDKEQWTTSEKEMKDALQQAQQTASELTDVVKIGQKDADLVASIRGLAQNPKYADLIKQVDNALQGLDVEEEKGDKTPEQVADQKHKVLAETQETLQGQLEDQKNEVLLQRADMIAKDYLAELPTEFTEADKNVVSEMWANRLDWDQVMEAPDKMPDMLKDSLQKALNDYGEPRGKIAQDTKAELEKATETPAETTQPSVADRMGKYLGKNYGEIKDGKQVISDDELNKDMADVIRLGRE